MSSSSVSSPPGYAPLTTGIIVVCTTFPILSTLSIIARFWIRNAYNIPIQADDWILIPALLFTIVTCGCGVWGAIGGHAGSHDVFETDALAEVLLKAVYYLQIFYICALPLIKCSILVLYNRVFPTPRFRLVSYCVATFLVCWWIAFEFSTIFQCHPISGNWLVGSDAIALCINEYVMYDIYSATNLFTDIFILAMPWPIILRLQMETEKKIQLIGIFLLGSFICIAGIAHLVYVVLLVEPWTQADSTHYNGYIFIWYCIEPCTAIICACLPTYSPLIRSFPVGRFISTTRDYLLSHSLRSRNGKLTTKSSNENSGPYWDENVGSQGFKAGQGFAKIPEGSKTTGECIPLHHLKGQRIHSTGNTHITMSTNVSTNRS